MGAKIIAGSCTKVKNNIDPHIASGGGQFPLILYIFWPRLRKKTNVFYKYIFPFFRSTRAECQLLGVHYVIMAHYTPTIPASESQYPDNQNTTTISTSLTFCHQSRHLRAWLTGSSSTIHNSVVNLKKHNGQTFWADIKYQRVKYLLLSWNVSKT